MTTLHTMDCKSIAWFLHCSRHKSTTKKWLTPFAGNLSIRQTSLFMDKITKFGLVNYKCTCFPLVNIGSIVLLLYVCVRFSVKPNVILQNRVQTRRLVSNKVLNETSGCQRVSIFRNFCSSQSNQSILVRLCSKNNLLSF